MMSDEEHDQMVIDTNERVRNIEAIMEKLWEGFSAFKESPMLAALLPTPRKKVIQGEKN
jgi:hypothetical protein